MQFEFEFAVKLQGEAPVLARHHWDESTSAVDIHADGDVDLVDHTVLACRLTWP